MNHPIINMRKVFLSIVTMLSFVFMTACGQGNKGKLTSKILQKATSIQYYTDNGTVAPDYHFGVTVVVSKDSVSLTVTKGYKNQTIYHETAPLTTEQYQQFIQQLANQSIHHAKSDAAPTSGGSAESIKVMDDNGILFQGGNGNALKYKGDLSATFHDVLPDKMAQVFRNPH